MRTNFVRSISVRSILTSSTAVVALLWSANALSIYLKIADPWNYAFLLLAVIAGIAIPAAMAILRLATFALKRMWTKIGMLAIDVVCAIALFKNNWILLYSIFAIHAVVFSCHEPGSNSDIRLCLHRQQGKVDIFMIRALVTNNDENLMDRIDDWAEHTKGLEEADAIFSDRKKVLRGLGDGLYLIMTSR